jgi:hypothetical protein
MVNPDFEEESSANPLSAMVNEAKKKLDDFQHPAASSSDSSKKRPEASTAMGVDPDFQILSAVSPGAAVETESMMAKSKKARADSQQTPTSSVSSVFSHGLPSFWVDHDVPAATSEEELIGSPQIPDRHPAPSFTSPLLSSRGLPSFMVERDVPATSDQVEMSIPPEEASKKGAESLHFLSDSLAGRAADVLRRPIKLGGKEQQPSSQLESNVDNALKSAAKKVEETKDTLKSMGTKMEGSKNEAEARIEQATARAEAFNGLSGYE